MADTIVYTLETRDLSTGTVNKIQGSFQRLEQEVNRLKGGLGSIIPNANQWERQMQRLTTVNGLAFEAFRRFNAAISGFFFGGAIGIVIGALNSVTGSLFEQAKEWVGLTDKIDRYKKKLAELQAFSLAQQYQAERLILSEEIKARLERIAELDRLFAARLEQRKQESAFQILQRNQEAALAREREELQRLIDQYNALGESLRVVTENEERAEKTETKAEKEARLLREIGFDPLRSLNLQYRRDELDLIAKLEAEDADRRIADERTRAKDAALIKKYEQDLVTQEFRKGLRDRDQLRDLELERQRDQMFAIQFILGSFMAFQNSNSRAMFRIAQLAAIADATIHTYMAANKALASAPPPWNYALASAVVAAGLANVARIASTSFGGGGGGGGAGAGGAGAVPATGGSTPEPPPQRVIVELNMSNVVFADEKAAALMANLIIDPMMKALGERGGSAGGHQLVIARQ